MYSDTNPKRGDSENTLLFKWAQLVTVADATVNPPRQGDSNNALLFKICTGYSNHCSAADAAPKRGDSDEILLAKILRCTVVCPT